MSSYYENQPHILIVLNMGEHFFPFPAAAGDDYDCSGMPPFQVMYWRGALTGFVFTHIANLPSNRYGYSH